MANFRIFGISRRYGTKLNKNCKLSSSLLSFATLFVVVHSSPPLSCPGNVFEQSFAAAGRFLATARCWTSGQLLLLLLPLFLLFERRCTVTECSSNVPKSLTAAVPHRLPGAICCACLRLLAEQLLVSGTLPIIVSDVIVAESFKPDNDSRSSQCRNGIIVDTLAPLVTSTTHRDIPLIHKIFRQTGSLSGPRINVPYVIRRLSFGRRTSVIKTIRLSYGMVSAGVVSSRNTP